MTSEVRIKIGDFSHIAQEIATYNADGTPRDAIDVTADVVLAGHTLVQEFGVIPESTPEPAQQPQNGAQRPEFKPAGSHQQQAPQQRQAPQGDQRLAHSWGLCPQCGTEAKPSIAQYQQWEEDDEGNEVPAKHFCPNDNCPTKSLWRRQLTTANALASDVPF